MKKTGNSHELKNSENLRARRTKANATSFPIAAISPTTAKILMGFFACFLMNDLGPLCPDEEEPGNEARPDDSDDAALPACGEP